MKNRNILKLILLLTMVILSYFFILSNNLLWVYEYNNLIYIFLLPILLPINIYLLEKKSNNKFTYLFSIINGIFLFIEIINIIKGYFEYNNFLIEYFYILIISYVLINSILELKRENSITNDLLLCIISFIIIVIHIRYYFDNSFLHNLLTITDNNNIVLQNSYSYITGYYGYFIIMFIIVLINKKINSIKCKV